MMAEQKEPIIISVSDPGGIERDYVQDVVIPFAGKEFAVLVSIPEDGENVEEPEIILARVDTDKNGEAEYVPPTDEEYDAVSVAAEGHLCGRIFYLVIKSGFRQQSINISKTD